MRFIHDCAPAHFSAQAHKYLNHKNCWIVTERTQSFLVPKLKHYELFLKGHLKTLVYKIPIHTENELRNRIVFSCESIRNSPGIL